MTEEELLKILKTNNLKKIVYAIREIEITSENLKLIDMANKHICKITNNSPIALATRASIEMILGKLEEAERHLTAAYNKDKKNSFVLYNLALLYINNPQKALSYALKAEKFNKSKDKVITGVCNFIIGQIYYSSSNPILKKESIQRLKKAAYVNEPAKISTYVYLFYYYANRNESDPSLDKYKEILLRYSFFRKFYKGCELLKEQNLKSSKSLLIEALTEYENLEMPIKAAFSLIYTSVFDNLRTIFDNSNFINFNEYTQLLIKGFELTGQTCFCKDLGFCYYNNKLYNESINWFEKGFLNSNNPDGECANNAGYIIHHFTNKNIYDYRAIDYYKKAIDLGCYRAAINLADLYRERAMKGDKSLILFSLNMYKTAIRNLDDTNLLKEAQTKLASLYSKMKEEPTNSFDFMVKLIEKNLTEEKLFLEITNWFNKKVNVGFYKIPEQIKNQFIIGIYNGINIIKTNEDIDFSSAVFAVSKGLELLIKNEIVEKYYSYLIDNHLNIPSILKLDNEHKTEIFYTSKTICELANKNNKSIYQDFSKYILKNFNIYPNKINHYLDKLLSCVKQISYRRNLGVHCLSLSINEFEKCLDILFFEDKFIQSFVLKHK